MKASSETRSRQFAAVGAVGSAAGKMSSRYLLAEGTSGSSHGWNAVGPSLLGFLFSEVHFELGRVVGRYMVHSIFFVVGQRPTFCALSASARLSL